MKKKLSNMFQHNYKQATQRISYKCGGLVRKNLGIATVSSEERKELIMYQHGGDIYNHKVKLDFSSNVNLLGIPQGVIQAACKGVSLSYCYPDTQCLPLREAIAAVEQIPMEQIICGNGAADIIFSCVLSKKPKKALVPMPTFHEYEQALHLLDCEIVYYQTMEDTNFTIQEDFLEFITEKVDIIFLCNPNNPTGNLIHRKLMERILDQCEKQDVLLVVDECFMDFVEKRENYTIKDLCNKSKYLLVLKAFTKLYAMPGLRLGYGLCSNHELIKRMKQSMQPWNVSIPAQMAGIAALEEKEYVKHSLLLLREERTYLINELIKLEFKIFESKANYIFFKTEKGLYEKCLKKGILIRNCSNYKGLEEGYYRIVVKTREENMQLIDVLRQREV
jgi:threonine-phosphate decarboxylase